MAQTQEINHRGMDKVLGDVDQFPELATIVKAIFSKVFYFDLPSGRRHRTKIMANGECFAVDLNGRRYIQQNRRKDSLEGARARAGARIIWVIQTRDANNQPMDKWIGKIKDGIVRMR